ncbi:MAG: adenylate/guanylate cyclase domain-containing protein [Candidatus Obscuribacterales bacterium]|nr:adenylate/guanylate cyclase domain-containing protein [Candidatus Obscuribacterales bacterium]
MTAEKQMEFAGYLVVNSGTPDAFFFELEHGKVLEIGRKPGSPTGPRKLVLPIPEVSSLHAELRPSPEGWSIRDNSSTNGTRLNGNWLTAGQEYLLKNGDHIKVAQVDLIVNLPESAPQRSDETRGEDEHERTQLHIKLMTATILVADIRAFTTLSEHYSDQPDVVMQAAQRVFGRFHEEIQKQQGQVEKIAGDAVMAYWQGDEKPGFEHKICAYQSCLTALKIRDAVPQIAAGSDWPFAGYPLQVDIALATGPVAAGVLGAGKASMAVLGDTANLAFRMEKLISADRPGDVIVDSTTYEMVQDKFVFESMGSHAVKGRQRAVELYRLLALKT